MSSAHIPRRGRGGFRLKVRSADPIGDLDDREVTPAWHLPPSVTALLAGAVAAGVGWVLVVGLVFFAWLSARAGELPRIVGSASQIWLLAHGATLRIGDVRWTLMPLGLTLLFLVLVGQLCLRLLRDLSAEFAEPPEIRPLARTAAFLVLGYALVAAVVGLLAGSGGQALRAALGAAVLAAIGVLWGVSRAVPGLMRMLPGWAAPIPAAAGAAVGTLIAGGAAALTVGLVQHQGRIATMTAGLGVDGWSLIGVTLAQLAYWPNLLIWAGSWTLGSGFALGDGTVVSPPATELGLVPSVPVLGALPSEGAGHWLLVWLVTGVLAGVIAGLVVLRRRPHARVDEAAGVSALAGAAALAAYFVGALLSRGDLGSGRLTGVGPRLGELLLFGGALIVLPAALAGLLGALVPRRRSRAGAGLEDAATDRAEPTIIRRRGAMVDEAGDEAADEAEATVRVER
ncbi:MAG: DUF6350 family protein [Propionibacteriaceae bacterium]|nr:DUF6350 family protein [Propionibacteriaceae bacterium]